MSGGSTAKTCDLSAIRERVQQLELELVRLKGEERVAVLETEVRRVAAALAPRPTGPSVMPEEPTKLALSIAEAADALSVCSRTIWTMIQQAGLPHIRVGGQGQGQGRRIIIPVAELTVWLSQRAATVQPKGQMQDSGSDVVSDPVA